MEVRIEYLMPRKRAGEWCIRRYRAALAYWTIIRNC